MSLDINPLTSIEMCDFAPSETFALSTLFCTGLLTNDIACSLLLDQAPTELLHWTAILPRSIRGLSDD